LLMLSSLVTAFILLSNEDDLLENHAQKLDVEALERSDRVQEQEYEAPPDTTETEDAEDSEDSEETEDEPPRDAYKPDAPEDNEFPSYSNKKPSSTPREKFPEEHLNAPKDWKLENNSGGSLVDSVAPAGRGTVQEEVDRMVSYLESETEFKCHNEKFVGSGANSSGEYRDGAYHLCDEEPYWIPAGKRMTPCLGYSFGIDYEWSFDDALAGDFGCEVHSFDPGMYDEPMHFTRKDRIFFHRMGIDTSNSDEKYSRAMRDYSYRKKYGSEKLEELRKWKVRTIKQFMLDLGHRDKIIDIVKIDIEGPRQGYEIDVIRGFLQSGAHRCIRQLSFELHLFGPIANPLYVRSAYGMLKGLEAEGWKLYGVKPSFAIDIDDRRQKIASEKTELLWCVGLVNTRVDKCTF